MICKCPTCGSALKFDPQNGKMVCAYCGNTYDPSEVKKHEEMECSIYTCTSCGGELMVNGVETSTFCSFCGQPTIVFSRVSKELQPDLILPFSVTKDEAVANIRNSLAKSIFVPRQIKNFDIERVRGIYMPFWLCDVDYEGKAIVDSDHGDSDSSDWQHHYRHGKCSFRKMTADASRRFNDDSSQRLEPYDLSKVVPFEPSYLSGFYADRFDVPEAEVEGIIKGRAKDYYNKEMFSSISGSGKSVIEESVTEDIIKADYAMLPVWFLTFRHEDKPYTFLVNGQTGKVIGGVPFNKKVTNTLVIILSILLLVPCCFLCSFLMDGDEPVKTAIGIIIAAAAMWVIGNEAIEKVRKANELTTSVVMRDMVKEREEEQ